ncbi:hypothetical protein FA15DRAFT_680390 [Coprinopsis marcescibilis]|uniref:Methyltransferase domain-containing protein n=1 Tax=Coprinopsis marcescibilis TaxID=230819 RepID=A0A5C3KWU2_COPMA|nr:hypothetical protein FA15DRAFT_680390 [Coprinopsis marcescibilis]
MASRTAGGRKRLRQEPTTPSTISSKPFRKLFSRSKSVAPPPSIPDSPPLPSPKVNRQEPVGSVQSSRRDIVVSRSETPSNVRQILEHGHGQLNGYPPSRDHFVPYPSPQESPRGLSPYPPYDFQGQSIVKKSSSASDVFSNFQAPNTPEPQFPTPPSQVFLEATYQPPPPPTNSRHFQSRLVPANPQNGQFLQPSAHSFERNYDTTSYPSPQISPSHRPLPEYSDTSPTISELTISSPAPNHPTINSLLLQPASPRPPRRDPPSYGSPQIMSHSRVPLHTAVPFSGRNDGVYSGIRADHHRMYPSPSPSDYSLPITEDQYPSSGPSPNNGEDVRRRYGMVDSRPITPDEPHFAPYSRGHPTPSIISKSSSSSRQSSGSQDSEGKQAFIFPGGRSAARPKVRSSGSPRLKFKKKSGDLPTTPVPGSPVLPSFSSRNASPTNSYAGSPPPSIAEVLSSPASSVLGLSTANISRTPETRPRKGSTATAATGATTTSSNSSRSNPGFVYPGGRSRAQPAMAPITIPNLKLKARSSKRSLKSTGSVSSDGNRARFMGITLKKKKSKGEAPESPMAFTLNKLPSDQVSLSDYNGSELGSTTSNGGPAGPEFEVYREQQMSSETRRHERMARIKSRIGSYPLDPYDSILLDNDRHTGDLLHRLNGTTSPSFYDYGNIPPMTVLDLGCGQGHWVVDAAIAWKGHGTKVTGYDMVDISKVLIPWANKQGVSENIRFVRGNFLKQRLPFPDNSFDLVRMSSLTLCITADAWIFVFQEICRVLTVGGRLELIDDSIIFPYGKPASTSANGPATPTSTPRLNVLAPRLDIHIPSSAFSTFSIYEDSERINPGLGILEDEEDVYDLYQVKEEEAESDLDDTATLSGIESDAQPPALQADPRATPVPRARSNATQASARRMAWLRHDAICRDLEALFEHMLTHKFGIHMRPEEFVLELMQDVFGHAREIKTMHLSLAPPDVAVDEDAPRGRPKDTSRSHDRYGGFGGTFKHIPSPSGTVSSRTAAGTPLSRSPGLVLSPSTFIPMAQGELEIHASKHLRLLLSCKKFLVEHAMEATEDEEIDEDSVLEALWEYEGFLRARFNCPPNLPDRDKSPSFSDAASTRGSILSVSSDGQDAMWEYQSELRQRFAWPEGTEAPTSGRSQITPKVASMATSCTDTNGPNQPNRTSSPAPTIAPPYSRSEMTHVRTFRVYEAIKLVESILGLGSAA